MRKKAMSIEEAKSIVEGYLGSDLKISVNKGRKRIVKYTGSIDEIYPSVFTLKITDDKNIDMLSFSYSDFICGDIKINSK